MTLIKLPPALKHELLEAVREERELFMAWNNAKENLRKIQEKILVETEKTKKKE